VHSNAQTIDKKKVLAIIKAAKQNKSVSNTIMEKKEQLPSDTIVVYRKKSTPSINKLSSKSKLLYSSLPNIPPSSILLRNKFATHHDSQKKAHNSSLFKTPIQTKHKGIKTTATKISYY